MSKIYKFPNTYKEFEKLAHKNIEESNFDEAIIYTRQAINLCVNSTQKKKMLLQLAKLFCTINKIVYSNEVLFQLLYEFPRCKQAFIMLMVNMSSMNESEISSYYLKKSGNFINQLIKGQESLLDEDEELDIESFESLMSDIKENTVGRKSCFTLVDARSRRKEDMSKGYVEMALGNYNMAKDLFLEVVKAKNISKEELNEIYNAISCCYYFIEDDEQCYNYLMLAMKEKEDNIDTLCLLLSYSRSHNMISLKKYCLNILAKITPTKFSEVYKIVAELNSDEMYDEALEIIKENIVKHPYNYEYNKFKAILMYNKGNKQAFRDILLDMDRLYGKLVDARYYLKNIKIIKKNQPINIDLIGNSLPDLTIYYEKRLESIIGYSDEKLSNLINEDLLDNLTWLVAIPNRNNNLIKCIGRLFAIEPDFAIDFFAPMMCNDVHVQTEIKIVIAFYYIQILNNATINYVENKKFASVKIKNSDKFKLADKNLPIAYNLAISIAIFSGISDVNLIYKTTSKLAKKIIKEGGKFDDFNCIASLILLQVTGKDVASSLPFIDIDEDTLKEYKLRLKVSE